mmetsp:Transcript_21302/g.67402  ORF Transcript_21302/g.67402 Transcript_21302/m.67402 type:complete len:211 (-) Transcript_21302:29-661(-)
MSAATSEGLPPTPSATASSSACPRRERTLSRNSLPVEATAGAPSALTTSGAPAAAPLPAAAGAGAAALAFPSASASFGLSFLSPVAAAATIFFHITTTSPADLDTASSFPFVSFLTLLPMPVSMRISMVTAAFPRALSASTARSASDLSPPSALAAASSAFFISSSSSAFDMVLADWVGCVRRCRVSRVLSAARGAHEAVAGAGAVGGGR